jgi:hypothetical protein
MQNDEVIERIKKLLRMKRGGTPGEIENALSLAQKLAARHNLDINSINENEPDKEPITHEDILSSRLQWECKYAALILQGYFNVEIVLGCGSLTIVGTEANIAIARYVYNYLIKHFRHEWKTKRGRLRNRQAFFYGMYKGLAYKLWSAQKEPIEKEGIILTGNKLQLKNYIKEHFGKTKTSTCKPDSNARQAELAGIVAGRNTNIRSAITQNQGIKLLESSND